MISYDHRACYPFLKMKIRQNVDYHKIVVIETNTYLNRITFELRVKNVKSKCIVEKRCIFSLQNIILYFRFVLDTIHAIELFQLC